MFQLPKSVLSYGAVAFTAGALMLAAPRATHAIAATLVQVTNTAANPAVAQSPNTQAAQLVNLNTQGQNNQSPLFYNQFPDGSYSYGYTVPVNQYLVITSADLAPAGCTTVAQVNLQARLGTVQFWTVSGVNTLHFDYPQGVVVAPGSQPSAQFLAYGQPNCNVSLQLHGYLTSN